MTDFKLVFKPAVIILVALLSISCAHASQLLILGKSKYQLSSDQQFVISTFLDKVEKVLPPQFKSILKGPIKVNFLKMDSHKELILPSCPKDSMKKNTHRLYGINNPYGLKKENIWLNQHFIKIILEGENKAAEYDCGHQNAYQLAKAAVIHELSHLYDFKGRVGGPHNGRVSSDKRFKYLNNYNKSIFTFFRWNQKNKNNLKSPSANEGRRATEDFAINMEFFLLDSSYQCRRPSFYHYLSEHFQYKVESNCEIGTIVNLNADPLKNKNNLIDLNPDRIYQIHYVVAGKGPSFSSRWGHSMFKFVICSPEREIVGPECLKDVQYHVIANFRAQVTDINISSLKGAFGFYPSQLFFQNYLSLIDEYTRGEFRDVYSVSFNFNNKEKDLFVYRVLEQFWGYQGRYWFLNNNCGHESNQFLKSLSDNKKILNSKKFFPIQIMKYWGKNGITDNAILDDKKKAIELGMLYESQKGTYEIAFKNLKNEVTSLNKLSLEDYLSNTETEYRKVLVEKILKKSGLSKEAKIRLISSAIRLEGSILIKTQYSMLSKVFYLYMKGDKSSHRSQELDKLRDQLEELTIFHPSVAIITNNYGIPLKDENELYFDKLVLLREDSDFDFWSTAETLYQDEIMDLKVEIKKIKENNSFFYDELVNNL